MSLVHFHLNTICVYLPVKIINQKNLCTGAIWSKYFEFLSEVIEIISSVTYDNINNDGPLIDDGGYVQYTTLKAISWKLKLSFADNCAMIEEETVILISNVIFNIKDNTKHVIGKVCQDVGPIYNYHLILEQLVERCRSWSLSNIFAKF